MAIWLTRQLNQAAGQAIHPPNLRQINSEETQLQVNTTPSKTIGSTWIAIGIRLMLQRTVAWRRLLNATTVSSLPVNIMQ